MSLIKESILDFLTNENNENDENNNRLNVSYSDILSNDITLQKFLRKAYDNEYFEEILKPEYINYIDCKIKYCFNYPDFKIIIFKEDYGFYTILDIDFKVIHKNIKSLNDIVKLYPDYMTYNINSSGNDKILIKEWEVDTISYSTTSCHNFNTELEAVSYIVKNEIINNITYTEDSFNTKNKLEKLYLYKNSNYVKNKEMIKTLFIKDENIIS